MLLLATWLMWFFRKNNNKKELKVSPYIPSPNFLLHQNEVWHGGDGELLRGTRILWEEQSCTHCQMFFYAQWILICNTTIKMHVNFESKISKIAALQQ